MPKVVTWNVNGIRSIAPNSSAWNEHFLPLDADILCLQETKTTLATLPQHIAIVPGYDAFFAFNESNLKGKLGGPPAGYSGVVTYCRSGGILTPLQVENRLQLRDLNKNDIFRRTMIFMGPFIDLVPDEDVIDGYNRDHDDPLVTNKASQDSVVSSFGEDVGLDSSIQKNILDNLWDFLDSEGRCIITYHVGNIAIINVYVPNAASRERRLFKLLFLTALHDKINQIESKGFNVILLGDMNICPYPIDHCDPHGLAREYKKAYNVDIWSQEPSRLWLYEFFSNNATIVSKTPSTVDVEFSSYGLVERGDKNSSRQQFIDAFRWFHPNKMDAFTCWNTQTKARETNYGTRIDLILVPKSFMHESTIECGIWSHVQGSDHCPVFLDFKVDNVPVSSREPPSLCAKYYEKFTKRQASLTTFLVKPEDKTDKNCAKHNRTKASAKRNPEKRPLTLVENQHLNVSRSEKSKMQKTISAYLSSSLTSASPSNTHAILSNTEIQQAELIVKMPSNVKQGVTTDPWHMIFKKPKKAPICEHGNVTVFRTVKKEGPNFGRNFYVCSGPSGDRKKNPIARCNFFKWAD